MNDFKISFSLEGSLLSVPFYFVDGRTFTSVSYNLDKFDTVEDLISRVYADEDKLRKVHNALVFCAVPSLVLASVFNGVHFSA